MTTLELHDIQGIIRRGYGKMESAHFVLLEIEDAAAAKRWLGQLVDEGKIRDAIEPPAETDTCVNVAFTQTGFNKLGLDKQIYGEEKFSIEFEYGMTTKHRSKILGDVLESAPDKWEWGAYDEDKKEAISPPVHVLLLLYALNESELKTLWEEYEKGFKANGLSLIKREDTHLLPGRKEHFGFRDGIGQPGIAGLLDKAKNESERTKLQTILDQGGSDGNIVAAGEFILGYKNAYKKMPTSPIVKAASDQGSHLTEYSKDSKDFGRNGSYLVYRKMKQNVFEFWDYIDSQTKDTNGKSSPEQQDWLAAKMVGRWRSGAPLTLAPNKDPNDPKLSNEDVFGYYENDRYGEKCPVASHVRRANPRDSKAPEEQAPQAELINANKHRIIRRARAYGTTDGELKSLEPQAILAWDDANKKKERGLQFICFNANLGRQFEFVIHTWVNNPKFEELYSEADPLLGTNEPKFVDRDIFGKFVAPREKMRQRVSDLQRFVEVRAGAYFFMPSLNAIKYLAQLP